MNAKTANIVSTIFIILSLIFAFGRDLLWNLIGGMFGGVQPTWWNAGLSVLALIFSIVAIVLILKVRKPS